MITNLPHNLQEFLMLSQECRKTQEAVLLDIVTYAKNTAIGQKLQFENIKDIKSFQQQIKTTSWRDFENYSKQLENGKKDLLFPGTPPFFICTSGSTGKIKYIPESIESSKLKSLTTQIRLEAMQKFAPSLFEGKIFPLVNHAIEGYTSAGIAYGSASGITLSMASEKIKNKVAFPIALVDAHYNEWTDYFLMRFAISEDVRLILGNNAGRLAQMFQKVVDETDRLIEDIEHGTLYKIDNLQEELQNSLKPFLKPNPKLAQKLRDEKMKYGKLLPQSYWPNLTITACWLSGSVGRYKQDLEPFLDKKNLFFDIGYGATEGKFNIPIEPNQKAGILNIYSIFYEFRELQTETFLLADELEIGKSYEIFITTYSGLYRYNLGDIIYVDNYYGTTPTIFFEQKSGDMLNVCGEKVGASSLIPLINQAVKDTTGKLPHHWCVIADEKEKKYHFCIELSKDLHITQKRTKDIENRLEQLLMNETLIYPIFRTQNLIQKLSLTLMKNGWQQALYKEKVADKHSTTQTKLPLVYKSIPLQEYSL